MDKINIEKTSYILYDDPKPLSVSKPVALKSRQLGYFKTEPVLERMNRLCSCIGHCSCRGKPREIFACSEKVENVNYIYPKPGQCFSGSGTDVKKVPFDNRIQTVKHVASQTCKCSECLCLLTDLTTDQVIDKITSRQLAELQSRVTKRNEGSKEHPYKRDFEQQYSASQSSHSLPITYHHHEDSKETDKAELKERYEDEFERSYNEESEENHSCICIGDCICSPESSPPSSKEKISSSKDCMCEGSCKCVGECTCAIEHLVPQFETPTKITVISCPKTSSSKVAVLGQSAEGGLDQTKFGKSEECVCPNECACREKNKSEVCKMFPLGENPIYNKLEPSEGILKTKMRRMSADSSSESSSDKDDDEEEQKKFIRAIQVQEVDEREGFSRSKTVRICARLGLDSVTFTPGMYNVRNYDNVDNLEVCFCTKKCTCLDGEQVRSPTELVAPEPSLASIPLKSASQPPSVSSSHSAGSTSVEAKARMNDATDDLSLKICPYLQDIIQGKPPKPLRAIQKMRPDLKSCPYLTHLMKNEIVNIADIDNKKLQTIKSISKHAEDSSMVEVRAERKDQFGYVTNEVMDIHSRIGKLGGSLKSCNCLNVHSSMESLKCTKPNLYTICGHNCVCGRRDIHKNNSEGVPQYRKGLLLDPKMKSHSSDASIEKTRPTLSEEESASHSPTKMLEPYFGYKKTQHKFGICPPSRLWKRKVGVRKWTEEN